MYAESADIAREFGEQGSLAVAFGFLGILAVRPGDYAAARLCFTEIFAIWREERVKLVPANIAWAMEGLAAVAAKQGDARAAARLFGAAEALSESINYSPTQDQPNRARRDRNLAIVRASFEDETALQAAWAEGRALTMEQAIEAALAVAQEL